MTAPPLQCFPPTHGMAVGVSAPQKPYIQPLLYGMLIIVMVLAGLTCLELVFLFVWPEAAGVELPLTTAIFTVFFVLQTVNSYLNTKPVTLVLRMDTGGVEQAIGKNSVRVAWDDVQRVDVVGQSGHQILRVVTKRPINLVSLTSLGRLTARMNQQLLGTSLAAPLLTTGLNENGVLEAVRHYSTAGSGQAGNSATSQPGPPSEFLSHTAWEPPAAYLRYRRRLVVGIVALAVVLSVFVWTLVALRAVVDPSFMSLILALWGVAGTMAAVALGLTLYRRIVPFKNPVPSTFSEPVVRFGTEGVEHVADKKSARVSWEQVRRVHVASGQAGSRFLCVTTADPFALLAGIPYAQNKAQTNHNRYGAPVAVPLANAMMSEADLLGAIHHYSGGRVAIG